MLQRLDDKGSGSARAHLDLASSAIVSECRRHEILGAIVERTMPDWMTLRSPAGIAYCVARRDPDTGTL
ncbi:MAG: VOC family protein [Acidimicrobiales bacterium]